MNYAIKEEFLILVTESTSYEVKLTSEETNITMFQGSLIKEDL